MRSNRIQVQGEYFPGRAGFNTEAYDFVQSLRRMHTAKRKRKAAWKAIDFAQIKHKIAGRRSSE